MPVVQDNAGWCWFHRERALSIGGVTVFGSVAGRDAGAARAGDLRLTAIGGDGKTRVSVVLDRIAPPDDHNVPALCWLGGDRLLAAWQGHDSGTAIAHQVLDLGLNPLSPVMRTETGARVSYSNLFRLPDGRVLNFHRGRGRNPNCLASDDPMRGFVHAGTLLRWPRPAPEDPRATGLGGGRPYVVYAQDGPRLHIAAVEDHPRSYDTSVHHAVLEDGVLRGSDGRAAGPPPAMGFAGFTRVFEGSADAVPWVCDIAAGPGGRVTIAFSVQVSGAAARHRRGAGGEDIRYRLARWDGAGWDCLEVAAAGPCLYPGEDDYSGLVCIDPEDPDRIALSAGICPATGAALSHREIYLGRVDWTARRARFEPVTAGSSEDNIRPVFSRRIGGPSRALLWMAGRYASFNDFDTAIHAAMLD
ncbi:BNR-4 repeat-containing protein [Falsiroseomonas sp. HW251]|uniref:BNR-4 repeat-containing protein n=1 Tax=Falsiroseomonas sp. HW251 TaxID=3390998 RepID=UPI003D31A3BC